MIQAGRTSMPTSSPPSTHLELIIMLDSAKDIEIEDSTFLTVARDYIHNEHHYQPSEIVINVFPSVGASSPEGSNSAEADKLGDYWRGENALKHRRDSFSLLSPPVAARRISGKSKLLPLLLSESDAPWLQDLQEDFDVVWYPYVSEGFDFQEEFLPEAEDPRTKLQQRIRELQNKRQTKVLQSPSAERKQTERRKPFGRPPRRSRSRVEMGPVAHSTSPPSSVIYSTDPGYAKHSNYEPDADGEEDKHPPDPNNTPFPLNSYTSPDFDVYDELYQNPPDTDWEGLPDPDPYTDDINLEEPPTAIPPPHSEYWHAYNAWYAWYTHCVASWQASWAAWTAALMSWSPPWLGMCAPSWLGAWGPCR